MSRALALAALLLLAACGLRPLYGGGGGGVVATGLAGVQVDAIPGRTGFLLRDALRERLGDGQTGSRYRLVVAVDDQLQGFGVRVDDAVTRQQRRLRTRYQLVDAQTGETLLDATAGSDAGIDVVSSEYATVAAENTAVERLADIVADQMVSRIALYLSRTAPAPQ